MTRRLVIIEPNLKSVGGHCFDYARVISREAVAAGFEVHGAFHSGANADIATLGFPFVRVFRRAPVALPSGTGFGAVAATVMGERATQWVRRAVLGAPANEDDAALARAAPFADELAEAIAAFAWTPKDRVYFPTVFWAEAAIVAPGVRAVTDSGAKVSVCLRFDTPDGDDGRARLRNAAKSNAAIDWCADTDELAAAYADIFARPVRTIRIPVDLERLQRDSALRPAPSPVRVAFIGESRREKGFHLLPDLVADLRREMGDEVRFTIQIMPGDAGADATVAKATERLQSNAAGVDLVHGALDQDAFHGVLAASHVLLLPYAPKAYARRSSGLLVEGLAAGLAIVTPSADSWVTRTIARNEAGSSAFFYDDGDAGLSGAVLRATRSIAGGKVIPARAPSCATLSSAPWTDPL